jgi:hypothetical protein
MSAPVLECSRCGSVIPEEALETGSAINLLGKSYCSGCKAKAVQDISLDELVEGNSPPPKPATKPLPPEASPRPTPKAAPPPAPTPRASPSPRRPETARHRVAQLRKPSRLPIVGGVLAALVAVGVAAFLMRGGSTPEPPVKPPVGTPPEDPTTPKTSPADTRAEQARTAYTAAEIAARDSDAGFDEILAVIDKARPACKGTPHEAKLEELRNRVQKEKELVEATRLLNPLIEKLKAAVGADPGFARYAELVPEFERARELAARSSPQKLSEITVLQQDYFGRYEKAAEPYFVEIREYAEQVADEKRYDLALKKIETFPSHLRRSSSWRTLEKLKQDIERRKAASK